MAFYLEILCFHRGRTHTLPNIHFSQKLLIWRGSKRDIVFRGALHQISLPHIVIHSTFTYLQVVCIFIKNVYYLKTGINWIKVLYWYLLLQCLLWPFAELPTGGIRWESPKSVRSPHIEKCTPSIPVDSPPPTSPKVNS